MEGIKIKSIKAQMITILVIFSLILFGALSYIVFQQLDYMPEFIQENHLRVVEARADEITKELKGIEDIVVIAAHSPVVKSMDMEGIQGYLPHLMVPDKVRNMTISDVDGNAWTTYDAFIDISNQEQFRRIFVDNEYYVLSAPFESPFIEEEIPIMTISYSVLSEEEEKVGLVNAVVSMAFIEEILINMSLEDSGVSYIIDENGNIVSHPNHEIGIENHISELMVEAGKVDEILESSSGAIEFRNNEGTEYLSVYTDIKGRPGWKMIMSIPISVAYAEYHSVIDYISWTFLVGVLLITIFAYFYANTLSNPILALKSVFESAAAGNLNVEADTTYPNEFGETGAAFNKMLSQIKDLTFRDPVTNLYNQNSFMFELNHRLKKEGENSDHHYLLLVSIDDFKRIDSISGHGSGDQGMIMLADRLKNFVKEKEIIGRYNGDEILLYIQSQSKEGFMQRLIKLQNLYYSPIDIKGIQYRFKTSIGVREIVDPSFDIKEEIKEVTVAKQKVKNSGGNGYEFYNKLFEQEILEEQQMEEALFYAIEREELYLVYQPILSLEEDLVVGHEALLRWNHPVYGKIPIPKIIELAEKSGLIIEIGEWVLTEACIQNRKWFDKGFGSLTVAVNLSALQMADSKILSTVKKSLNESGMDPELLNIEITETVAMRQIDQKIELMNEMKEIGIKFSIDDFGTGYSSLSYFTNFPVDILKVDRSFIHNMLRDENAKTVTTTIIQMAKALNLKIIAEGVETQEHIEALKKLQCTHYQGYLVSKPDLPPHCEEIINLKNGKDKKDRGTE